jgi:hypothetical protein
MNLLHDELSRNLPGIRVQYSSYPELRIEHMYFSGFPEHGETEALEDCIRHDTQSVKLHPYRCVVTISDDVYCLGHVDFRAEIERRIAYDFIDSLWKPEAGHGVYGWAQNRDRFQGLGSPRPNISRDFVWWLRHKIIYQQGMCVFAHPATLYKMRRFETWDDEHMDAVVSSWLPEDVIFCSPQHNVVMAVSGVEFGKPISRVEFGIIEAPARVSMGIGIIEPSQTMLIQDFIPEPKKAFADSVVDWFGGLLNAAARRLGWTR